MDFEQAGFREGGRPHEGGAHPGVGPFPPVGERKGDARIRSQIGQVTIYSRVDLRLVYILCLAVTTCFAGALSVYVRSK